MHARTQSLNRPKSGRIHAPYPFSPLPSSSDSGPTTSPQDRSSFSSPGCSPLYGCHAADNHFAHSSSGDLECSESGDVPASIGASPSATGAGAGAAVDFSQRRRHWLREPPPSLGTVQRRCLSSPSFRAALSDRLPSGQLGLLFTDAAHAVLTESFLDRASFPTR